MSDAESVAAGLRDWATTSALRHRAAIALLASAEIGAAIAPHLKAGRRTPDIDLRHGGHPSGHRLRFTRAANGYVPEWRVTEASADVPIIKYAGSGNVYGGSTRLRCHGCGKETARHTELWIIARSIQELRRGVSLSVAL